MLRLPSWTTGNKYEKLKKDMNSNGYRTAQGILPQCADIKKKGKRKVGLIQPLVGAIICLEDYKFHYLTC